MSQTLEERFTALVSDTVVPTLKPRGYRKQRLVWTRTGDAVMHQIVLQRSQGNAPDHLRVYIELAAYSAEFARTVRATVPDDLAKATPQYTRRFESVAQWPAQWIDLEDWTDAELHPALTDALVRVDDHLAALRDAPSLADALRTRGPLNLDLFAWSCATGDEDAIGRQLADAHAEFGVEERWPRLFAQFERTAARFERELDPDALSARP